MTELKKEFKHLRLSRKRRQDRCGSIYSINNQPLKILGKMPHLVAIISNDLKCNDHLDHLSRKAKETLGILRRSLKYFLPGI